MNGAVLAIIGPSACGKSAVMRELVAAGDVHLTPTWTTRPPRGDERDGELDHVFVNDSEFDRAAARGLFLGTAQPFGLPHRYGLPRIAAAPGMRMPVVMLRAPFVAALRRHCGSLLVYQVEAPPAWSAARLEERRARGNGAIGTRLAEWREERDLGRAIADRVFVNGDGASVPALIRGALAADLRRAA